MVNLEIGLKDVLCFIVCEERNILMVEDLRIYEEDKIDV